MEKIGCRLDGYLNDSNFTEPMPWIGVYVAVACMACAILTGFDVHDAWFQWKTWWPCKFFSLNATSLTLTAVATKLSVDLNTPMPRHRDQLSKLSSSVLMCTVMGNSMPSLGTMANKEILMNMVALTILVITLIVNICMQLGTGVIFVFWIEHVFVIFLMLVLLVILCFTALTVPTTKKYLETKYNKKHKIAMRECSNECKEKSVIKKLKEDLMKFWVMAHTSSPQFVMGRSVTCTASGAFCLLAAVTLAETMIRSYLFPSSFKFCSGQSDYLWSIPVVLNTHTIAVGIGTIAPACRCFIAIAFRCPKKGKICMTEFKIEGYWTQKLIELKECPLTFSLPGRRLRKLAHDIKNQVLDCCIGMQIGVVLVSKFVRIISIFLVSKALTCFHICSKLKRKLKPINSISNPESESGSNSGSRVGLTLDLSRFVLYLEGEEVLVELMMKKNCDDTAHWIRMAKKGQPKSLIKLIENPNSSRGFNGVGEFDSDKIPSLDCEEPPNCWALPIVTLTSICIAISDIDRHLIKQLLKAVSEGLPYARFVQENSDVKGDLMNNRKAAEMVWVGVDLYHKWLDVDLNKLKVEEKSPKEILEKLSDTAKGKFMEPMNRTMRWCFKENPSQMPVKAQAANSMYRISKTLLLEIERGRYKTSEKIFEGLYTMISDIFGACFTNLQEVIIMECLRSTIEEKEESVRRAVSLLGKTRKIMKILGKRDIPCLARDQMVCIDEWRVLKKQQNTLPFDSSSLDGDLTSINPCDLYISIDCEKGEEFQKESSLVF